MKFRSIMMLIAFAIGATILSGQNSPRPAAFKVGDYALSQMYGAGDWYKVQIVEIQGNRYNIRFPDGLMAYTDSLRRIPAASSTPAPAPAAKMGQPPKPGLVSCAGKIEGRYGASSGFSNFTIVFHAGKATIKTPFLGADETECWMSGKKIFLHKPGDPNDMPIDINDDGTLDTPFGEVRKKGN